MKRRLSIYAQQPTSTGVYKKRTLAQQQIIPIPKPYRPRYYAPRQEILPEKKFHDLGLAFDIDFTAETAGAAGLGQLDLIAQGDTESTRDGRQCTIDSIEIKGTLTFTPGAGATASGMTAIYLVQDTQANGAQAVFSDIFTTTVVNTCVRNLSNGSRFRILKKWIHTWNPPAGATTAYNTQTKFIDTFKKCNIPLEFSSTTGAIGELKSNHIFLAYGATLSGIDDLVSFAGKSRLRFRG